MKLRHAAALALVGWYLMVPPPIGKGEMIDLKAPLAKWNHWGESPFKTEKDCYNWQQQFLGMNGCQSLTALSSPGRRERASFSWVFGIRRFNTLVPLPELLDRPLRQR